MALSLLQWLGKKQLTRGIIMAKHYSDSKMTPNEYRKNKISIQGQLAIRRKE
jgi:hypothetical protein